MIITVASGKGGTGKTTVAVSLALSIAGQSPLFIDCDVEEPNAALFLKPQICEQRDVMQMIPQIKTELCTLCGRCAEVCQYHAIANIGKEVLVFPELCHGCGSCTLNCPTKAIEEIPNVIGSLERGHTGQVMFAQGTLNVGEPMSVPVIRRLKKWSHKLRSYHHPTILDAPPGASCPVVETMRGADAVLLVTEPTPFGLHDLKVAVQVARDELHLPVAVIINRDGIGDSGVQHYCESVSIPILMHIPLQRTIAESISQGMTLVDIIPDYRVDFVNVWKELEQIVHKI